MFVKNVSLRLATLVIAIFAAAAAGAYITDRTSAAALGLFAPAEPVNVLDAAPPALGGPVNTNGGSGLDPTYGSLAAAITALNAATITDPVVITLNTAETAPAGGFSITATGTTVNTITINGGGNTVTANAGHTVGALNDAIFKIIGGDNITINGFVMNENAANTTTVAGSNNMTEFGVALFYASAANGCQNITISNNTIDLDRTYQNTFGIYANSTHTATAMTTAATATGAAGGNHGLAIRSNNITDVNMGIVVVGPTAAADMNDPITIGGTAPNANTITNYGTTGTFSGYANVSGSINGILVRNSKNVTVSHNSISSSVGGVTAGTLNGIQFPAFSVAPTGTFTQNVNNNSISLQPGNGGSAILGINHPSGSASVTSILNINNNNFNSTGHTVAATAAITFILNAGTHLTQNVSNNTFTNMTVNTTGNVTFISNSNTAPAGGTKNVNGNSIVTGFNKTGSGGTVTLFTDNGSDPGATNTNNFNNNNFSNMTLAGVTSLIGISSTNGGAPTKNVNGNTINNVTSDSGTMVGISTGFDNGPTSVSGNTVSNISGGSLTGITLEECFKEFR